MGRWFEALTGPVKMAANAVSLKVEEEIQQAISATEAAVSTVAAVADIATDAVITTTDAMLGTADERILALAGLGVETTGDVIQVLAEGTDFVTDMAGLGLSGLSSVTGIEALDQAGSYVAESDAFGLKQVGDWLDTKGEGIQSYFNEDIEKQNEDGWFETHRLAAEGLDKRSSDRYQEGKEKTLNAIDNYNDIGVRGKLAQFANLSAGSDEERAEIRDEFRYQFTQARKANPSATFGDWMTVALAATGAGIGVKTAVTPWKGAIKGAVSGPLAKLLHEFNKTKNRSDKRRGR